MRNDGAVLSREETGGAKFKSPPFEGGESAPAKRERDSAKHQEKAQTGWFLRYKIGL